MTRTCAVEGCGRGGRRRRGWCDLHYSRWQRTGDPGGAAPLRATGPPQHGTYTMYQNHGCRCDACRQANTDYIRERNHRVGRNRPRDLVFAERHAAALARDNHGTESRYRLGCRCDECRTATTSARRTRRQRVAA